jgi:hypothetical protein
LTVRGKKKKVRGNGRCYCLSEACSLMLMKGNRVRSAKLPWGILHKLEFFGRWLCINIRKIFILHTENCFVSLEYIFKSPETKKVFVSKNTIKTLCLY